MMRLNWLMLFLACLGNAHAQPAGCCTPSTLARPIIAAHRGANRLVPEDTLWAYRYAIAHGAAMIEFDVQQTRDGRCVSFHDQTLDDKPDGADPIGRLTLADVRALNAADNDHWRGLPYDPSQIPTLEEVLQLARETGVGIYFDFKGSVRRTGEVAHLAELYGVGQRASFLFHSNSHH
jgi:glycerophosphoryl diester phosphodiesterase